MSQKYHSMKEDSNSTTEVMRNPRSRPDLRLAESYIPGVVAWFKGIIYTSLCLVVQYGNIDVDGAGRLLMLRALPLVILYYDHLIYSHTVNSFVDGTAVATDVIAATIAAQFAHLDYSCTSMWCWLIPLLWAVCGATHVYLGDGIVPRAIGHIATATFVLSMFLFSKGGHHHLNFNNITSIQNINNNNNMALLGIWPYYARAASYLSFVIIDAYMLRAPLQREKDRIGLLRYGSVLFAPIVPLIVCAVILIGAQVTKIYFEFVSSLPVQTTPVVASSKPIFPPTRQNAVDALDVQEAFRLAKLQYMDGKASV